MTTMVMELKLMKPMLLMLFQLAWRVLVVGIVMMGLELGLVGPAGVLARVLLVLVLLVLELVATVLSMAVAAVLLVVVEVVTALLLVIVRNPTFFLSFFL